MSVAAIGVRFADKILKPDDVKGAQGLTTLEVIYEGGSLHGKTADFCPAASATTASVLRSREKK